MELKKLEYLESIYRLRSFTKAANENFISQPSITSSIKSLEEELGVTLIQRKSKPLRFTQAGEQFMVYVYTILNAVNDAVANMKNLSPSKNIVLRIGITSTIQNWFVQKIYTDFQSLHPSIELSLLESTLPFMLDKLLSGELDLLFTLFPDGHNMEDYESIPLGICELGVLLPENHCLAKFSRISLEQLEHERLMTFPPGSLIRSRLENEFRQRHIRPAIQTVSQLSIATRMAASGYGLTFTTQDKWTESAPENGLLFRPFAEPIFFLQCIILKTGRPRTVAMQTMISFLLNAAE
ncbi:MAG: LysR family transcriptional regulator, partial [Lachnospiraceae bacterium]|nr:LysR family transcriptional regulator [Lachnospiraceae bacterium]